MRRDIIFQKGNPRGPFEWVAHVDRNGTQHFDWDLDRFVVGLCLRDDCELCWELPKEFEGGKLTVDLDMIERRGRSSFFVAHITESVQSRNGCGTLDVQIDGSYVIVRDPNDAEREILVGVGRILERESVAV